MCKAFLKTKELVNKGHGKVDKNVAMKKGVKNVEVTQKQQNTLAFKSYDKIIKINESNKEGHRMNGNEEEGVAINVNEKSPFRSRWKLLCKNHRI